MLVSRYVVMIVYLLGRQAGPLQGQAHSPLINRRGSNHGTIDDSRRRDMQCENITVAFTVKVCLQCEGRCVNQLIVEAIGQTGLFRRFFFF